MFTIFFIFCDPLIYSDVKIYHYLAINIYICVTNKCYFLFLFGKEMQHFMIAMFQGAR